MPETAEFAIDRSRRVRAAARHVCDAAREIVASSRAISAAREPEGTPECGGCGQEIEEQVRWTVSIGPEGSRQAVPIHRDQACVQLYVDSFSRELDLIE